MIGRWGFAWLVGAMLLGLAAGVVSGAAAQGAPWRIVQGRDGTAYLLKDGARYAIVGDEIGDDELAGYAEGDPIGSALLLNAIVPRAQAPAAQAVTQPAVVEAGGAVAPAEAQAAPPVGDAAPAGADPNAAAQTAPTRGAAGNAKPSAGGPPPTQTTPDMQFLSVQGNTPGQSVSVTVQAREGASCSIEYVTPMRTRSTAAGLGPQTVGASRTVTWSFMLDAAIKSGNGTVMITCDQASISRTIAIGGLSK
jgi:hypothetical protein